MKIIEHQVACADLVFHKETEGERKDDTISHRTAEIEHSRTHYESHPHAAHLLREERRTDELPYLVYQVWEYKH